MEGTSDNLRLGTVFAVDLATRMAGVRIGGIDTPWIEFATARAGKTKIWLPPSIGEQVEVVLPDGDWEAAYIGRSLFSDANPAPSDKPGGLILFEDGSTVAYDPVAHHLEILLAQSAKAKLVAPDGFEIIGDVTVNGKIEATGDVTSGAISLQNHKHSGVQAGSAQSGKPV